VLLIHHFKLDKWFQPGGHCDGDCDVLAVAMKEASEETGQMVRPVSKFIFDVDNHIIPQRGDTPEHIHYDIRLLFEADMADNLGLNREIKAIKWVEMGDVANFNSSESILRMVRKSGVV
jgi:8-oxo-dGTP pyrophosphatase MutT (NUDIX family)